MNQKEMFKEIIGSFFVIFTVAIMGLVIYHYSFGLQRALLIDIVAIFIISIFTALAGVILYPSREPKRLEMILRYVIHSILIFVIIFAGATYMRWIIWSEPLTVIRFAALIVATFITVHAVIFYQTKKLADELNEKLKERYNR